MARHVQQATSSVDEGPRLDRSKWREMLLTLVTGVMLYFAISLLLNPVVGQIKINWSTFYGDF